jgi:hypothetical protein
VPAPWQPEPAAARAHGSSGGQDWLENGADAVTGVGAGCGALAAGGATGGVACGALA